MQYQTVGFVQTLNDCVLEGAVQPGHVDLFLVGIVAGPEEVPGDPVHRQAVGVGEV